VAGELADYKAPDELLIVDELPLTAMLKPDRIALRELITLRDAEIQRRR
jgi:acyl-CoA synthetase (AMP-forming)/AMP-acid ligase II